MGIQERVQALEPRERQLLAVLVGVFMVILLMLIPLGVSSLLGETTDENELIRQAIDRLQAESGSIAERKAERDAVLERYARPAPALAGYLDSAASTAGVAIPEIKDRAPTLHGKKYEERATAISLKKVGLVGLVKFMERISTGTYPISITTLDVRKRGVEPDSYDVEMTVSAFHRIEPKPSKLKPAAAEEGTSTQENKDEEANP